jgi:hypothetical protein
LVLLVLAVVWGVVLFSWFRSRARSTFGDPVGTFRRHLTVLEHTGPTTVRPANRLSIGANLQAPRPPAAGSRGPIAGARGPDGVLRGPAGDPTRPLSRPSGHPGHRPSSVATMRRRQALKRRRDVLLALLTGAVGSLLLGVIPGLHVMLLVQLVFDLLLGAYLCLLIRLRNLAAERERKLAYLPRSAPADLARAASARSATRATPGRASQVAGRRRPAGGLDRLGGYDPGRYDDMAMRGVVAN